MSYLVITCLRKYLEGYKRDFGFNPSISSALRIKTKDIRTFSRRGGSLFDEVKLSEHLTVRADGSRDGFVSLDQYTTSS